MVVSLRSSVRPPLALGGAVVLALLAAVPAAAQDTGTISGIVVDNSQQVVPGATVTLVNERTAASRTAGRPSPPAGASSRSRPSPPDPTP
jgi:type 1 fimbria pilin